jgi:hypothetical protein
MPEAAVMEATVPAGATESFQDTGTPARATEGGLGAEEFGRIPAGTRPRQDTTLPMSSFALVRVASRT